MAVRHDADTPPGREQADDGRVGYEGVDITDLRPDERAERKLIRRFELIRPLRSEYILAGRLDESAWEPVFKAEFSALWEAEYAADIRRRLAHVSGGDTPLFAGGAG